MIQSNRYAVVTGASSGIGKALALELACGGYDLILISRRKNELEKVASDIKSLGKEAVIKICDLANIDSVVNLAKELVECYPNIYILVNNAGVSQRSTVEETSFEVYKKIMDINFFSSVAFTSILLPIINYNMGKIIVISSLSGLFGFPMRGGYAASKHALKGFFETLQLEENKIDVLIAYPGRVNTQISLTALTGSGKFHGKIDQAQLNGISAVDCARRILQASKKRKRRIIIGGKEVFLYYIYIIFRPLFYIIASRVDPNK